MFTVTRDTEVRLVEMVNGVAEDAASWRGVFFRFDMLLEQYRSDYQIQIAVNLLNDLLVAHQGAVFVCVDRTIFLVCRNVIKSQLEKAIFQLRYLFMDDPLAYDSGGDENPQFCRIYDLGKEYAEFYQLCRKKLSQSTRADAPDSSAARVGGGAAPAAEGVTNKIFTPTRLAHAEQDLNKADLSRVFRKQPICAVNPAYDVRKVFDEYYIHISHLRQLLHADTDFLSNRSLFKYLTEILDLRMLDMLASSPSRYFDGPVSLNFNVSTLLSRKFRDFDALIKPLIKVSLVIEIQVADVFADMSGFIAARNIVQRMGYKVCLDGLTNASIMHIDRERLGFDLAKLQWNSDVEADLNNEENLALQRAIQRCGHTRIILCRCDTRQAVNYGQAMGIGLFQGRFLDRVLNPNQKVEN